MTEHFTVFGEEPTPAFVAALEAAGITYAVGTSRAIGSASAGRAPARRRSMAAGKAPSMAINRTMSARGHTTPRASSASYMVSMSPADA